MPAIFKNAGMARSYGTNNLPLASCITNTGPQTIWPLPSINPRFVSIPSTQPSFLI